MSLLRHVPNVWWDLAGGFIAYCLHVTFHGVYHRILHLAVRLAKGLRR